MKTNQSKTRKKFKSWVIPSIIVFICCIFGFVSWYISDEGKPDFAILLTIITFIIWGFATSKGFSVGLYEDSE